MDMTNIVYQIDKGNDAISIDILFKIMSLKDQIDIFH